MGGIVWWNRMDKQKDKMPAYKPSIGLILICFLPTSSPAQTDVQQAMQKTYAPIDLSLFRDGISHWQKRYGRDRNDARYDPAQIVHIAENLLQYQNPDGGWPVDLD